MNKKIMMSIVSIIALSSLSFAGGGKNLTPPPEPPVEIVDDSSFYVGIGYSYMNMNIEGIGQLANPTHAVPAFLETDISGDALLLLAGYNYNKYIALEGRYTMSMGDLTVDSGGAEFDIDADMSNIGLYLKPMYPMGGLTLYGLLGFGQVTFDYLTEYSESSFQWGLGASYAVNENIGVFVDYTRLYDDTGFDGAWVAQDVLVDAISVGVTYTF